MKRFIIIMISLVLCTTLLQAQQAWTRAKGGYYTQLGVSYLKYNSILNGTGNPDPLPFGRNITDLTYQFYGEYGLSDKLLLSLQLPFKSTSISANSSIGIPAQSLSSFSNIQAALTANFYKKDGLVLSGKANIGLPSAKYQAESGIRTGFDSWLLTPSLLAGFGHQRFFSSAELGYVFRTNGYSNRFMFNWQIGTSFLQKKLYTILALEVMKSGDNGTFDDANAAFTALYLDKQSYIAPILKIGYKPNENIFLWLSAGGGLGSITKNVGASPGISFSVAYQK